MGREAFVAKFANRLDIFVKRVFGHFLHQSQSNLMRHAIMKADVEPVLFGHLTALPRAFVWARLGHHRQQLMLEMNLAEMLQVGGHSRAFDRANLTIVRLIFAIGLRALRGHGRVVHRRRSKTLV